MYLNSERRRNAGSKKSSSGAQNGWREFIAASGRLYYHHKATKTTQWKPPEGWLDDVVSSHAQDSPVKKAHGEKNEKQNTGAQSEEAGGEEERREEEKRAEEWKAEERNWLAQEKLELEVWAQRKKVLELEVRRRSEACNTTCNTNPREGMEHDATATSDAETLESPQTVRAHTHTPTGTSSEK